MALFGSKEKKTSVVLIDITSSSVGGALAHVEENSHGNSKPILYYTSRHQIEQHSHEEKSQAMLRTLTEVANELVAKGGPTLRRETGNGHIDRIMVSVGAPWQKTTVRSEVVQQQKPFVFTKALLNEITQKDTDVPKGYIKSTESIISVMLNGYEIAQPFGKKATRAELIVLSSLLDTPVSKAIEGTLRATYHTHALSITTFASVAYAALRDIYPHQKDFLVLEISREFTDIISVKNGLLVTVTTMPHGTPTERTEKEWVESVHTVLQEFATGNALSHTLFMLGAPDAHEYIKRLLDTTTVRFRVIPVVSSHFSAFITLRAEAEGDVALELLTLCTSK